MKFKKIMACVLTALLLASVSNTESYAFGGYAHWQIATRTFTMHGIPTADNKALAYMSGTLLADIGKSTWDNNYTASDSDTFANKMLEISSVNAQADYFAAGWKSHVYQDTYGSVSDILGSTDNDGYRVNCGQIDEYLRDTLGINSPINGTHNLYVSYEKIRNTYAALHNFSPTNAEIDQEIEDMFFLYDSQIALNFSGMSATQIANMNTQFEELARNCYSSTANINVENAIDSDMCTVEDIMYQERYNPAKRDRIEEIEAKAQACVHLEVIGYEEGATIVTFVIDNPTEYQSLLEQHTNVIKENTILEVYE